MSAPTVRDLAEARGWPEDWSHENGRYFCRCIGCGEMFIGHKRRVRCRDCSMPARRASRKSEGAEP